MIWLRFLSRLARSLIHACTTWRRILAMGAVSYPNRSSFHDLNLNLFSQKETSTSAAARVEWETTAAAWEMVKAVAHLEWNVAGTVQQVDRAIKGQPSVPISKALSTVDNRWARPAHRTNRNHSAQIPTTRTSRLQRAFRRTNSSHQAIPSMPAIHPCKCLHLSLSIPRLLHRPSLVTRSQLPSPHPLRSCPHCPRIKWSGFAFNLTFFIPSFISSTFNSSLTAHIQWTSAMLQDSKKQTLT